MPVNPDAGIEITAFAWVPDFAKGQVRDLRPRWALEEIGLDYRERLLDATGDRPAAYFREQPWGQVPVLRDGAVEMFESGAILLHIGEKDERLLPADPQGRALATSWVFAALNSIEPMLMELATIDYFVPDEEWGKLRRPSLIEAIGGRLDRLADHLGNKDYLAGNFTIGDIAMATVLRIADDPGLVPARPGLRTYLDRCLDRPAFRRALAAQLDSFDGNAPTAQTA